MFETSMRIRLTRDVPEYRLRRGDVVLRVGKGEQPHMVSIKFLDFEATDRPDIRGRERLGMLTVREFEVLR